MFLKDKRKVYFLWIFCALVFCYYTRDIFSIQTYDIIKYSTGIESGSESFEFKGFKKDKDKKVKLLIALNGTETKTRQRIMRLKKNLETFSKNVQFSFAHFHLSDLTSETELTKIHQAIQKIELDLFAFDLLLIANDDLMINPKGNFDIMLEQFISTVPKVFTSQNWNIQSWSYSHQYLGPLVLNRAAVSYARNSKNVYISNLVDSKSRHFGSLREVFVPGFCNNFIDLTIQSKECDFISSKTWLLSDNIDDRSYKVLENQVKLMQLSPVNSNMNKDVTIIVKTSKFRRKQLNNLLFSVNEHFPEISVLVGSDDLVSISSRINTKRIKILKLLPGAGLSKGRNELVQNVKTKYTLLIDDDNILYSETNLEKFYEILQNEPKIDLVGGVYHDINTFFKVNEAYSYGLQYEVEGKNLFLRYSKITDNDCRKTFSTHNFFMSRTNSLKNSGWRNEVIMSEHEIFFFDFNKTGKVVYECPQVKILHDKQTRSKSDNYSNKTPRFSSFCPSYKKLCEENSQFMSIISPWHEANCNKNFVCHIKGSYKRSQQINTFNTTWREDPMRRIFCLKFSSPFCSYDVSQENVRTEMRNSIFLHERFSKLSQQQLSSKPKNFKDIVW